MTVMTMREVDGKLEIVVEKIDGDKLVLTVPAELKDKVVFVVLEGEASTSRTAVEHAISILKRELTSLAFAHHVAGHLGRATVPGKIEHCSALACTDVVKVLRQVKVLLHEEEAHEGF